MRLRLKVKDLFLLIAGVFGILSFFMVFASPLKLPGVDGSLNYNFNYIYFNNLLYKGAVLPFIAFFIVLGCAICFIVAAFSKMKDNLIFCVIFMAVALFAVIIIFSTQGIWCGVNNIPAQIARQYRLAAGGALGGIFGLVSIASAAFAVFYKPQ